MVDWLSVISIVVAVVSIVILVYFGLLQLKGGKISDEKNEFLDIRNYLKLERTRLGKLAFDFYKKKYGNRYVSLRCNIGNEIFEAPVLSKSEWIPSFPVDLAQVRISKDQKWDEDKKTLGNPQVNYERYSGWENNLKALEYLWPKREINSKPAKYSDAIEKYDKPKLWWDCPNYRMTDIKTKDYFELVFRIGTYFNYFNTLEALAFESAKAGRSAKRSGKNQIQFATLKGRKVAGDPDNLCQRCSGLGIATITLFGGDNGYRFVMHQRTMDTVAMAEGLLHVIPAGEFEPSADYDVMIDNDLDIWKNIMREINEELINPSGENERIKYKIDWENESPFKELTELRKAGDVRVFFLGFLIDPLNLKSELMTAVVFSKEAFEKVVPVLKAGNEEGSILWHVKDLTFEGHRFNEDEVKFFLSKSNFEPSGKACLIAAWNSRNKLLIMQKESGPRKENGI